MRTSLIITSAAVVRSSGAADAHTFTVVPSARAKCERCWHYRADVGSHAAHPSICGRCVSNLFGPGEPRHHA